MKSLIFLCAILVSSIAPAAKAFSEDYSLTSNFQYEAVVLQAIYSVTAIGQISDDVFNGAVEIEANINANICAGDKNTLGLYSDLIDQKIHYSLVVGTLNSKAGGFCQLNRDPIRIKFQIPVRIYLEENTSGSQEIGVLFAGRFPGFADDDVHERSLFVTVKNGVPSASFK